MTLERDLEAFQRAVHTLWNRLTVLTGAEATATLFRAVIHDAATDRPLLHTIVVTPQGVSLRLFMKNAQAFPAPVVRASMTHFLRAFLSRIREISGPVMAHSLQSHLSSFCE